MRVPLLALALAAALAGCMGHAEHSTGSDPVATQTIAIPGPWVFEPEVAEVKAGEPVTFVNRGGADHTVTFDGVDFDVVLRPGEEATHTFDTPGRFEYVCKYHPPDMRGAVVVVEGDG